MSGNAGDHGVGERHGVTSVTISGAFKRGQRYFYQIQTRCKLEGGTTSSINQTNEIAQNGHNLST